MGIEEDKRWRRGGPRDEIGTTEKEDGGEVEDREMKWERWRRREVVEDPVNKRGKAEREKRGVGDDQELKRTEK